MNGNFLDPSSIVIIFLLFISFILAMLYVRERRKN